MPRPQRRDAARPAAAPRRVQATVASDATCPPQHPMRLGRSSAATRPGWPRQRRDAAAPPSFVPCICSNMPCAPQAIDILRKAKVLVAPAKAASVGWELEILIPTAAVFRHSSPVTVARRLSSHSPSSTSFSSSMACCKLNWNIDVNKCLSELWKMLQLVRLKSGIKKLEEEMVRLRAKSNDIKNQIAEAERQGKIPIDKVNHWLLKVETLEAKVVGINQDFQSISCFSCNCFRESSNCCSIVTRVAKKPGVANELMSRAGARDPIATFWPLEPIVMLSISHQPFVGIESNLNQIVAYIDGEERNIIGIYGMGGVGKTTMLKTIQQHYSLMHTFDHVIWVVASKDCQLKRLQIDIAKSLGLNTLQENDNEQTCGDKLFRYLKNKKCFLFLDDIWEHVDMRLLGMAYSATERGQQQRQQPCKVVVFTTRSETICVQMKAEKKIKVKNVLNQMKHGNSV